MFQKLNITTALSGVLLLSLTPISGMDHPGLLPLKMEPGYPLPAHRVINPTITIDQMQTMFGNKDTKINKNGGKQNCVDCAISFYKWVDDQTIAPERVKRRKSTKNMVCDDDGEFAELAKDADNEKLDSKEVIIDLEDGSMTSLKATFDPITLELEDHFTTLEKYLDEVPFKFTLDRQNRSRAGLLYMINKKPKNTGHMINFYKCIENSEIKTFIIDPQSGAIKSLSKFIQESQPQFLNHGYAWYDKGENTAEIQYRNNFVKIDDGSTLPCQTHVNIEEGMEIEKNNGLLFQTDMQAGELSIMDIEEDRSFTKRPREENSNSNEPATKKQKVTKEKTHLTEEERKIRKSEYKREWAKNLPPEKKEERRQRALVANLAPEQIEKKRKRGLLENLPPEQVEKKRESNRIENLPPERIKKKRESNRIENMTPERIEMQRQSNRIENMTPDQIEKERKRHRKENMSEKRIEKKRQANRDRYAKMTQEEKDQKSQAWSDKYAKMTKKEKDKRLEATRRYRAKKKAEQEEQKRLSEEKSIATSGDKNPAPAKKIKKK